MEPTKPGYLTTEFYISLIVQIVPILVITGVLSPDEAGEVESGANQVVTTAFAFISAAAVAIGYVMSRAKVKAAALTREE